EDVLLFLIPPSRYQERTGQPQQTSPAQNASHRQGPREATESGADNGAIITELTGDASGTPGALPSTWRSEAHRRAIQRSPQLFFTLLGADEKFLGKLAIDRERFVDESVLIDVQPHARQVLEPQVAIMI